MNLVQTDLSDEALVTAIRGNLSSFFHHLGISFPDGYFGDKKFRRWRVPIPHPWFNGVLSSKLPEEQDEAFIADTIRFFRDQHVGVFTWWMEPDVKYSSWEPVLASHGFRFSNDTPGLAADLQALHEPEQAVDGLEVRQVQDEESSRLWGSVFTRGFGMPAECEPAIQDIVLKLGMDFPVRNYLGYLNGKPLATSSLYLGAGVAGIYNVSTLMDARRRGIGAALTLRPLQDAQKMGYRIGILQSSPMGFNIYRKLGFRHLCQIGNFSMVLQ